ncbi:MAG: tetratricopeptide repeat protein [Gemmataceae bacterium]|nr:tetratricopeptide repeat protein [Gemmataceae bacterium]
MKPLVASLILALCCGSSASAQFFPNAKRVKEATTIDPNKLPITKLTPSKLIPNLCQLKVPITTSSPDCQAFFDQGLGYFYSYVWMEAARSFETAVKHDPQCAMAYWGLSRAVEKWGKGQHTTALKKAQELLSKASHREQLLITARLKEKGMIAGITPENRKKEAAKSLDELLTLFDDDEEGWFARAQMAEGPNAAVPYYKALLRVNPLHPGAHHELVHHYENIKRPALGWPHALGYMQSSPNIPHAFHMQAHLGMRIGKWEKTTDWSYQAIEMQRAYHKQMGVKPKEDWQFAHHLETLMRSLIHDGRFTDAKKIKKECEGHKYNHQMHWFRLHLGERDFDQALKLAAYFGKNDKSTAAYLRALVYFKKGEPERAAPEVAVLQEAYQTKRTDKTLELRLWETQGMLMCCQGSGDAGLRLLAKAVTKVKDDYRHHEWGQGAYYMEAWGIAALRASRLDVAEEAFLEALAHDWGSVRGALGMQVVCERQGRSEEAIRFAELAAKCWRRADAGCLQMELADLRGEKVIADAEVGP